MKKTLLLVVLMLALPLLGVGAESDLFKNLAGTAEEMNSMRMPSADAVGTRSGSAMIPIRFTRGKWTIDLPVEAAEQLKISLLAPNSEAWQIVADADGRRVNLRETLNTLDYRNGQIGLDGVSYPAEVFSFDYTRAGSWRIEIAAPKGSFREGATAGYLVISNNSPYQIYTHLDTFQTLVGKPIGIVTSVFDNSVKGGAKGAIASVVETAEAELRMPDGSIQKLSLGANENGAFKGSFVPRIAGQYTAQVTVRGRTPKGDSFLRTSETVIEVLGDNARLGNSSYTRLIDDTRLSVNIPTGGLAIGRKVIAYGEIWGKNEGGEEIPVAWLSGMSVAGGRKTRSSVSLTLDARWLTRSDAKGDFELRNIRLQDADYFVTLAEAERMDLTITALPEAANRAFSSEISDEMRMGKRPYAEVTNAVGGKLMLVHGYCSGGNPYPTSQFSNNIVFHDPNKNRTHDQFANLIKNFGASYPSFGIVAHSQGGAASLHLYTYYWSGLDSATGSRLIQSVGTPYQGTALAGNLALLGQIFGAGCGSNANMSYSGAASWLAGIPTWARAKVNYFTTSFDDVWYRYDYCNIATDPFLGDPDDGVVERAYAQLPYAINRGHKTGWCHTGGMRDPAQTSDSARNADMNANAAR